MGPHELTVDIEVYNPEQDGQRALRITLPLDVLRAMVRDGYGQVFVTDPKTLEVLKLHQLIVTVDRVHNRLQDPKGLRETTSAHGEPKLMGEVKAYADGAWWSARDEILLMRRIEAVERAMKVFRDRTNERDAECQDGLVQEIAGAAFDAGAGWRP